MKKVLVIALALFTINGMAQKKKQTKDKKDRSELRAQMTPNDIADLKSKNLTLKLDLTDGQQQKVHKLILDNATDRQHLRDKNKPKEGEKREKPSQQEMVKRQNERLDAQIEMKREMKSILTEEQYAKFEKMTPRKNKKRGVRAHKRDRNHDKQRAKK
ncbi:hypothetical protein ITJ86_09445 [Winogradskyella sp. F6397]|uniref:DUF4890 domain-containing protein n=1 Tax=Winogradskyella marina TaxID=2785530 RepID=A0ABS0EL32_9FLAO|nr:Spy/CpxP family protein refolding chaperone [Winogradskyella marina]MBF8150120.1 hypothetical protein [Winogradskyella marina]